MHEKLPMQIETAQIRIFLVSPLSIDIVDFHKWIEILRLIINQYQDGMFRVMNQETVFSDVVGM